MFVCTENGTKSESFHLKSKVSDTTRFVYTAPLLNLATGLHTVFVDMFFEEFYGKGLCRELLRSLIFSTVVSQFKVVTLFGQTPKALNFQRQVKAGRWPVQMAGHLLRYTAQSVGKWILEARR
jgi:hypothetical protein